MSVDYKAERVPGSWAVVRGSALKSPQGGASPNGLVGSTALLTKRPKVMDFISLSSNMFLEK